MNRQQEAMADLGRYIRTQREIAQLSLRHLARMTDVSDSYLSQLERGLYQPSPDVLKSIAEGLGLEPGALFRRMGWLPETPGDTGTASVLEAIDADSNLTPAQKSALSQTYKAMVEGN